MRNWQRDLRRASFRGVRFWVEDDSSEDGRRVVVHQIVGGEVPVTEDMGRRVATFDVRAYVVSDVADLESLALRAACGLPGASLLTLPMEPPQFVRCLACRPSRSRDRAGYVGFDLSFVAAGGAFSALATGIPALRLTFGVNLGPVSLALSVDL
ncbi:hypothetical protein FHS55_002115 [Angulomicrobium tetraedrale]|uniref:DNA circulation N-terminal domain-containing protein n=1 Tax=Ancylobacter tetraedralis TaxID=217068 RepID=A0A839Z9W1_9HYPH|nr:DNA circularization N-terminal domain-containing protein [Ancylobacter tetraedralis]MBB3771516.1 hypothetical protein [Ancylobacter tetraedralis]